MFQIKRPLPASDSCEPKAQAPCCSKHCIPTLFCLSWRTFSVVQNNISRKIFLLLINVRMQLQERSEGTKNGMSVNLDLLSKIPTEVTVADGHEKLCVVAGSAWSCGWEKNKDLSHVIFSAMPTHFSLSITSSLGLINSLHSLLTVVTQSSDWQVPLLLPATSLT